MKGYDRDYAAEGFDPVGADEPAAEATPSEKDLAAIGRATIIPRTCLKCGVHFPGSCTCAIPTFAPLQHRTCPNCGAFGVIDGPLEAQLAEVEREREAGRNREAEFLVETAAALAAAQEQTEELTGKLEAAEQHVRIARDATEREHATCMQAERRADALAQALSKIRWINDCGVDTVVNGELVNGPVIERDAMYRIAGEALDLDAKGLAKDAERWQFFVRYLLPSEVCEIFAGRDPSDCFVAEINGVIDAALRAKGELK